MIEYFLQVIISLFAGAILYHYVDKVKVRKKMKGALAAELHTNLSILKMHEEKINSMPMTAQVALKDIPLYVYHAETFHSIRSIDPELYLELINNTPILETYQLLFILNEFRGKLIMGNVDMSMYLSLAKTYINIAQKNIERSLKYITS